jgi:hypothetical protein
MDEMWDRIVEADDNDFIMSAGTAGVAGEYQVNACGVAMAHSFTIVSAFTMEDEDEHVSRCLLMRNPWGSNTYNWRWSSRDPKWSDHLVDQIPYGFDPREDDDDYAGFFVVPFEAF